jgi:hypothetical protein
VAVNCGHILHILGLSFISSFFLFLVFFLSHNQNHVNVLKCTGSPQWLWALDWNSQFSSSWFWFSESVLGPGNRIFIELLRWFLQFWWLACLLGRSDMSVLCVTSGWLHVACMNWRTALVPASLCGGLSEDAFWLVCNHFFVTDLLNWRIHSTQAFPPPSPSSSACFLLVSPLTNSLSLAVQFSFTWVFQLLL